MRECICSTCRNLIQTLDEEGVPGEYDCRFGTPADACADCETQECDATCEQYLPETDEPAETVSVPCAACGKLLARVAGSDDSAGIYCVDCYLSRINKP